MKERDFPKETLPSMVESEWHIPARPLFLEITGITEIAINLGKDILRFVDFHELARTNIRFSEVDLHYCSSAGNR